MTAVSCFAIGVAFAFAVGLLIFAGVLIGWVIPALIERSRAVKRGAPPQHKD